MNINIIYIRIKKKSKYNEGVYIQINFNLSC